MSLDAGREMADISMVPVDLYADFFRNVPRRVSSGASLIRWVCEFAMIRGARNLNTRVSMRRPTSARRLVHRRTARTRELNALKGERKGFKAQCFHCGQRGHRLSACRTKDADRMKGKGKIKGFSKGKNPPQQQQQYRKGKGWYWSEPWSET